MSDDLEDSAQWRDTVETRLSKLETTVGEQARLRAAMDEDLSGARADRKMLQALHDTQSEHTALLNQHTELLNHHTDQLTEHTELLNHHTDQLTEHTELLNHHTDQLTELQEGQQKVLAGITVITEKLDTLIGDEG